MQNSESYVQQGEGTGAAIQLKPFNSSEIFKAYDYHPKKPLLDSFGKVLDYKGAAVHPNDRPEIQRASQKLIEYRTNLEKKLHTEKRDLTPEEANEYHNLKMEVNDLTSLAQKQLELARKEQEKIAGNPYNYKEGANSEIENIFNVPILQRPLTFTANPLPTDESYKWLASIGNPIKKGGSSHTNADGSSSSSDYAVFDEEQAKKDFELVRKALLKDTKESRQYIAGAEDALREAAAADGLDYNKLTPADRVKYIDAMAWNDYKAVKQAEVVESNSSSSKEAPLKDKDGTGKTNTKNDFGVISTMSYANYTPEGKRIPVRSGIEGGSPKLVRTASIPIAGRVGNDKFAQTNKEIKLFDFGKPFVGTLDKISIYGKPKSKDWEDGFWAVMSGKDDVGDEVVKEIFIDKTNKEIIEKEYEIKIQDLFDKHDWKGAAEALTAPHPSEGKDWDRLSATQKVARVKAWEEEYGPSKKATPSKTTEVDPDEEFKRK